MNLTSQDEENSELTTPLVFRVATRIIEKIASHHISLDSSFQETINEFKLSPGEQRLAYFISKKALEHIGIPIYILQKNKKETLPLRRRAAFYVAFYLVFSSSSFTLEKIRAIRGGLLSDSLLTLLTSRNIDNVLEEIKGLPISLRLAYLESIPPLLVESLLLRFGEREVEGAIKSFKNRQVWVRLNREDKREWVEEYLEGRGFRIIRDKDYSYLLEAIPLKENPLPPLPPDVAVYQNKASVIAVEALLSMNPRGIMVDLAAAPCMKASLLCLRGKTEYLLLVDVSEKRARTCTETMKPSRCMYDILNSDGRIFGCSKSLDAAIVDAPCTNSGALPRDPGLRLALWELDKKDLEEMKAVQSAILTNALKLVRPGAPILYSTCSVFTEEGEDVLHTLKTPHVLNEPFLPPRLKKTIYESCRGCYRLFPHIHHTDGFFFSILSKKEE
mgnify:CR=1 FL=1